MLKAFTYGIKAGFSQYRIAFLVYLIQLALAAVLGMQVHSVMDAAMGNSMEIEKLISGGYDHTVISDFLIRFDNVVAPVQDHAKWLILIYLFISVFINGGMLYAVVKKETEWKAFWQGGAAYFLPFLKIGLIFLAIFATWTLVLWIPILISIFPALEALPSEATLLGIMLLVAIIYLLGMVFFFHASVVARTAYMEGEIKIWPAIKQGFRFTLKKYLRSTGMVFLFGGLLFAVALLYLSLEYATGMRSVFLTWMFVVLQQVVAFFRILWRAMVYGGISRHFISSK